MFYIKSIEERGSAPPAKSNTMSVAQVIYYFTSQSALFRSLYSHEKNMWSDFFCIFANRIGRWWDKINNLKKIVMGTLRKKHFKMVILHCLIFHLLLLNLLLGCWRGYSQIYRTDFDRRCLIWLHLVEGCAFWYFYGKKIPPTTPIFQKAGFEHPFKI